MTKEEIEKYIRMEDGKHCVYSHKTDKKLACFGTHDEAVEHLRRIEFFSEKSEKYKDSFIPSEWLRKFCPECADYVESLGFPGIKAAGLFKSFADGHQGWIKMLESFRRARDSQPEIFKGADPLGSLDTPEKFYGVLNETLGESVTVVAESRIGRIIEKSFDREIPFSKVDDERRLIYGIVYEPDALDSDLDSASELEIEKAAHDFLLEYNQMNIMHKYNTDDVRVVESYIAPVSYQFGGQNVRKGSWIIVSKVFSDGIWKDVKEGKYGGYSMEGTAKGEMTPLT